MAYESILRRLADRQMILPYFEKSIIGENWPEKYTITIDSGPYYGAGDGYFHPSTHPLMGARQLYLMFHPDTRHLMTREPPSLQREMTLSMGSALHGVVQAQMEICGMVKPENVEVEYVNKEHHVRGRIDFIADHPNGKQYLVEMKTRTHFKFSKQTEILPSWDAQLSLAMDATGHDEGILLMVESGWPYGMREFLVPKNVALLEEIYAKFDYVRDCIASNTPPRHCCDFDSPEMNACQARYSCWLAPAEGHLGGTQ